MNIITQEAKKKQAVVKYGVVSSFCRDFFRYCVNLRDGINRNIKSEVKIMPRYKDSPEVRAAKQERRENLRELPALTEAEDVRDLKSVFKETVGEVLENGLEAELDDRQAKTAVPRDRKSEFEPQIIRKNETSISRDIIEEKIITMCAVRAEL